MLHENAPTSPSTCPAYRDRVRWAGLAHLSRALPLRDPCGVACECQVVSPNPLVSAFAFAWNPQSARLFCYAGHL